MKKINKYFNVSEQPSLKEGLSLYRKMAKAIQKDPSISTAKKFGPLSLIIPFAAASLSTIGVNAQCGIVPELEGGTGPDILIDLDGDGTNDFEIDVGGGDLFIYALNGGEVVANLMGAYEYVTNFASGAVISSSNGNWQALGAGNYATLEFGGAGNWGPTGSGFVGVRMSGNRLGFIQVTWDGTNVTVDGSLSGVQTAAGAGETSVQAGICTSLPVELVRLTGKRFDDHTELNWRTASENGNKGFEIQRSKKGINFKTVGFVNGQGNSTATIDYLFKDETVRNDQDYYYRLKQIDYWGDSAMSGVIFVQALHRPSTPILITPNPTLDGNIKVTCMLNDKGAATLTVFDMSGHIIRSKTIGVGEGSTHQLDLSDVGPGTYYIRLQQTNNVEYSKFIKN